MIPFDTDRWLHSLGLKGTQAERAMPWSDFQVACETVEGYGFDATTTRKALEAIGAAWKETSGRFYAYNTAHLVCSQLQAKG